MVGLGIPEEQICLVVRDRADKPICRNTLRRHFEKELQTGTTKLNARVGHFMVATIFGTRPPDGVTPIRDERVRGRLGELFVRARLGWRDDVNQQRQEERPLDVQDVRRRLRARIDRLAEPERSENSGEPSSLSDWSLANRRTERRFCVAPAGGGGSVRAGGDGAVTCGRVTRYG